MLKLGVLSVVQAYKWMNQDGVSLPEYLAKDKQRTYTGPATDLGPYKGLA